jgi:hypothetical protein
MTDLSHLHPAIRDLSMESAGARIEYLRRDRYVDHPTAATARNMLEDLLTWPRTIRPPCLLLHGPSGIGKSSLLREFLSNHQPVSDDAGHIRMEVAGIEVSPGPDQAKPSCMAAC